MAINLTPGEIYFIREKDVLTHEVSNYVKVGLVREGEDRGSDERVNPFIKKGIIHEGRRTFPNQRVKPSSGFFPFQSYIPYGRSPMANVRRVAAIIPRELELH